MAWSQAEFSGRFPDRSATGNSHTDERIELFNQFLERFGERELACLTADQELLGKDWFGYLRQEARPPFRIRIRHNHILGKGRQRLKASTFFQALQLSGEWLHQLKPLVVKKHGRRAESLFRYGFDYLRHMVLNLEQKGDQFSPALKFLSCT